MRALNLATICDMLFDMYSQWISEAKWKGQLEGCMSVKWAIDRFSHIGSTFLEVIAIFIIFKLRDSAC